MTSSAALAHCIGPLLLCFGLGCRQGAPTDAPTSERELMIFAAASLRDAFSLLGEDFERAHPGVAATFNFAGTRELRTQLEHGAAADLFASADQRHMNELAARGRALAPVTFARNHLVVIVSPEASRTIRDFSELPAANRLVVGTPGVPIGSYTLELLERAAQRLGGDFRSRVEARVVSRELNVRQVLAKVRLGEADAGIVYRTDAVVTPEVTVVEIPEGINVVAEYPIAVLAGAAQPELARAWVEHLRSAAGQKVLSRVGFLPPVANP